MKTPSTLKLALAVATLFSVTATAQPFLTNGLMAYYPFNGNANDASGNGNNGVVNGATLSADRFGLPNSAYRFNGSSWIQLPDAVELVQPSGLTLSAWVLADSGPYTAGGWLIHLSSRTGEGGIALWNDSSWGFWVKLQDAGGGYYANENMVFTNVWNHIVAVYTQGQYVELWVNGSLVQTNAIPNYALYTSSSFPLNSSIGNYDYAPGPYGGFSGAVDDVRIYNRALSASEVQQLHQYESQPQCSPPPPGLVGWWRGQGNGNDSAGTNNAYALPHVTFTNGIVGQAFAFDPENLPYGTYIGVQIPDQPYYALTNSLSIEGWIRPRGDSWYIFYRGDNRSGLDPYGMAMANNNVLGFGITDANGNSAGVSAPLVYNQWWHVAGTLDGASGQLNLYTNGSLAAQITTTIRPFGALIPGDHPGIGIGNVNDGSNDFPFIGDIDEISLYNRALSSAEIAAIYNAGTAGKCTSSAPIITGQPASVTVCAGSPAIFTVTAVGGNLSFQWQVSRDGGTTFTNISGTATNASYTNMAATVADSGNKYQVVVAGGGASVTSAPPAVLTVNAFAIAGAGGNQAICAGNSTMGLGGSVGGAATGGLWTSSGTGSFVPNATTLNAAYTPSAADITAGTVTLTLSATGQLATCPATAQVIVTINGHPAIATQPANRTVVVGSPAVFSVGATGGGLTYQWQVSQDGGTTFTNISNVATNASYTTAPTTLADNGNRYQAIVSGACPPPATSSPAAVLTVTQAPQSSLGMSATLEGPAAGSDSVVLAMAHPTDTWTATANAAWLHLSVANQSGTGSTNVVFSYDANPSATRIGTLTIAGQTLTVTQAGSTYIAAPGPVTALVASGLNQPSAVAVDGAGNLYIADNGNSAIKKWTAANNTVTTLVSSGLSFPYGVAVDGAGNVYIADTSNNAIKEWWVASNTVTTLVSSGLNYPWGVAVDGAANVYIGDRDNHAIKKLTAGNNTVTTLVGSGLSYPEGVALDGAGNVYLSDEGHSAIKKWLVAGNTVTTLVSGLNQASGVAVDGAGNVYIADTVNSVIKRWTAANNTVTTLIASGLHWPGGVAVDRAGNVYIADSNNNPIKELPHAFVDPTAKLEGLDAGSDILPVVLPATANLLAPFAPTSDQPWLTITGNTNGVVSFAFGATSSNRTAHITLLGQPISITQFAGITQQPASVTVCQGSPAIFSVTAVGHSLAYQWQVSQDGGNTFTNISTTATNASYTNLDATLADDGNQYQVTVTGTVFGVTSAPPAVLTLNASATASAGANQTICAGSSTAPLGGTVGGSATGGLWTTSGTGSFAPNATALNASYSPSAGDAAAGSITLTLTAQPCSATTARLIVTINPGATVNAGPAQSVCSNSPTVTLAGSYGGGATGATWSGAGTFAPNTTTMNATYTPTAAEIAAGSATVTLTTTGQLAPCAAASASMTIMIYTGLATANAGPNQAVSGAYNTGVQLAGGVANSSGTWSGGSGTFSPNAKTTNAVYYPTAAEVAAGSWVLTLTADASPCGGSSPSSSMRLYFRQLLTLPFNTNTSTLAITLMIHPSSGSTDLGSQSHSASSKATGYMAIELDNPDNPTQITVQDLRMTAMTPYLFAYSWTVSGVPVPVAVTIWGMNSPISIYDSSRGAGTPTPLTADGGAGGGSFVVSVPFSSSGAAYYSGTASGSLDLSLNNSPTNTMTGNIHVTNDLATAHIDFTVTTNITLTGSISITVVPTFVGHADMVGPTILPRSMVWNNGAGTFNWNTDDYNWDVGSARWDNRRPDSATFGATGIGTVSLTGPIAAGSLWFQNPGYTIAGSAGNGLTLTNACAITNDAAAAISAAIVGGSLNKWGAGTLTLSGANSYSGGTFVNAGVLQINADAALGTVPASPAVNATLNGGQLVGSSSLSLAANRTVMLGAGGGFIEAGGGSTFTINGNITGAGGLGVVWDGGTVVLAGTGSYVGATTIGTTGIAYNNSAGANPILQLGSSGALPGTDLIFGTSANANTATLDLHGTTNAVANLIGGANAIVDNLSGGTGTLLVGNNNADITFNGVIQNTVGTVALAKIGSGTLALASANTYAGATTISAGTLVLPSGGSLLSPVGIAAGATFDVSAQASPYTSPPLGGSGTASPAALLTAPGGTVDAFQTISLYVDGTHPALTVSPGNLSLNGNTFVISSATPLLVGTYPLINVASGSLVTNGTFTVIGPAIATGYGGVIEVSGNQVMLQVLQLSPASTTTLDKVPTPRTYGSVAQFRATVSPSDATGTVTFQDGATVLGVVTLDGVTGVAVCTPAPTTLTVPNNPHAIVAVYSGRETIPGVQTGYAGSVSDPASLAITPKPVTLSGTKVFDKATDLSSTNLSVAGNLDGGALSVSGTATLSSQNAGSNTIQPAGSQTPNVVSGHVAAGSVDSGTSMSITLGYTPASGNTLIATIGYRNAPNMTSTTSNAVATITQTGVTWTRAAGWFKPDGQIAEEIWYGDVTCGGTAGTAVTINFGINTVRAGAQIAEFSGVLYGSPVDVTGGNTGNSGQGGSFDSGPAITTTASPELWVAGGTMKGYGSGTTCTSAHGIVTCYTAGLDYPTPTTPNWFILLGQTDVGTSSWNFSDRLRTVGYYYPAPSIGGAQLTTTLNFPTSGYTVDWASCVATFKQRLWSNTLALSGPAAPNYNLTSVAGSPVTTTGQPITVTAKPDSKTYDGTTISTTTPSYDAGALFCGDTATASQTYATKDVSSGITVIPNLVINDGNGGANYSQTRINATGTINPKALTVSGSTATAKPYDGTTGDPLGGAPAFQSAEAPGTGTTADGKPYTGDSISVGGTAIGAFADPNAGWSKPVSVSGVAVTGPQASDYTVTQQTGLTANITPRVATLVGSRTYDGGTAIAVGNLTVANSVDGPNLTLSGSAVLAGRNVGPETITSTAFPTYVTPTRVRSAVGGTGTGTQTSFAVIMMGAPADGHTLVAVIATRSTTTNAVSSISQPGATWTRATATTGTAGSTTEIWYAPNVSGADSGLVIHQASVCSAAVVIEYSGVLTASPLDQVSRNNGSSTTPTTGTTPTTVQTSEVWVGGIGLVNSGYNLTVSGTPVFSTVASAQSASATSTLNAKVYALDYIAGATGAASSGGTISTSLQWSGAMATFKSAIIPGTLALGGSAANNYTLVGASGAATVAQTKLTVTAVSNTKPYDGTIAAAAVPTITAGIIQTGDTAPIWTETYDTAAAGTGKTLTPAGVVIDGNSGLNYSYNYVQDHAGAIISLEIVQPPANLTVCAGSPAVFSVGATGGGLTYQWQMSQDGGVTFTNISDTATNASYTNMAPALGDSGNQYQVIVSAGGVSLTSAPPAVLTVNAPVTASAGGNQTICAGISTLGLGGSVGGAATGGNWTSSGTGSFTPNATALSATYTPSPADITAGLVTLTLSATGQLAPCAASAQVAVTIQGPPAVVSPPTDLTACAGLPAIFTVAATGVGLSYQWQASYDYGVTFTNLVGATNASYTNPPVTLDDYGNQYQVIVNGECGPAVTSTAPAVLYIDLPPTVDAGPAQTVCAGKPATHLAGSFDSFATTATWSGAGTFAPNATILNAVYTPTAAEIAAGTATVTLTAYQAGGPCGPVSASTTITINPSATVDAGPNQSVCASRPAAQLAGSFGGPATFAWWSGAGSFRPNHYALNAIYTPTDAEIAAGRATVTLTTDDPPGPCPGENASMTIPIIPVATARTGGNQTICSSSSMAGLGGSVGVSATGGLWTSSGTGNFAPNATTLNATYNPSAADITAGTVTLTLSAQPCSAASAQVVVTISRAATAGAGANQTICAGTSTAALGGTVGGGAMGGLWTSSGTGTFVPDATTLNATYSPSSGDTSSGTVTLTLSTTGQPAPCVAATAQVVVTINPAATASTGSDQTICAGSSTAALGGTVGGGATGGAWTSSGSGSFAPDPTTLSATYSPSAADISAGAVTLTLSSTGQLTPCGAATAQVAVIIQALPAITSGSVSLTLCAGSPAAFTVAATGTGLTYQWQVSGDGGNTFASISDTATNASYTNAATTLADNGSQYQVIVSGACTPSQTSSPVVLNVNAPAMASAGGNQTICSGSATAALGGTVGGGATGGTWSSSGTGSFEPNATALGATYNPSAADIAAGTVILALSTTGQVSPCGPATAQVVVMINLAATANVGGNHTICAGASTLALGGSVGGAATGGIWSSSGTGGFVPDPTTLNATYAPSAADISAATVTLTLTATGQAAPCAAAAQMTVTIQPLPAVVTPPTNLTVQAGSSALFSVSATGPGLSYQWQFNGTNLPSSGGIITTVAGNGGSGFSGDGGAATDTSLSYPAGVSVDGAGNLFIADTSNSRIRKVDTNGIITTVAGIGSWGFSGDGGAATNAMLANPLGVAVDGAGNLFIADYNNSRIRKVDTSGIITTVAGGGSSVGSGDGGPATNSVLAGPVGVAVDAAGNVFIADYSDQRIRKVDTSGIITTVAGNGGSGFSGDGGAATNTSLYNPNGVAVDGAGNLFIADDYDQRIRKVDTNGIITTVAGTGSEGFSGDGGAAINATLAYPVGVAVDGAGNLFIVEARNSRVRKVDTSGIITTLAGTGSEGYSGDGGEATNASFNYPQGVAVDGAGHLFIADADNERIRKVVLFSPCLPSLSLRDISPANAGSYSVIVSDACGSTSAVATLTVTCPAITLTPPTLPAAVVGVAYSQSLGASGGAGACGFTITAGSLPAGLILSGGGVLRGTPSARGTNTFTVTARDTNDCTASQAYTLAILGVVPAIAVQPVSQTNAFGSKVIFQVTATGSQPLSYQWRFNGTNLPSSGGIISTVAGNGSQGFSGDGGAAIASRFFYPWDVQVDGAGNLFITDTGNARIRKVDINGIVTTVAGNGGYGFSGDGGWATNASLYWPQGAALDGAGNLFIADYANARIRKVDINGSITTVAGIGLWGFSGDGGAGINASVNGPHGLAADAAGNLFIADKYNQRIRKLDTNGIITTVAGNGSAGFSGDGGAATDAPLAGPYGVAVDGAGNLFIANADDSRIRKVDASGIITTVAGNGSTGFSGDGGAATNAGLNGPYGVAVDCAGNLFIADTSDYRIRKVDTRGIITTVAGNGSSGFSGDGGWATNAKLNAPYGVAADEAGNLFIADPGIERVRKVVGFSPLLPTLLLPNISRANAGSYSVIVSNAFGSVTSAVATLTVPCPAIALPSSTLPDAVVGVAYSQGLSASGGAAPYRFTNTVGSLPVGLSLSSGGVLSGVPAARGSNTFTVTATDSGGCSGSQTYTLGVFGVIPVITVQPGGQANTVGFTVTFNVAATGSQPFNYQWQFNGTNLADKGRISGSQSSTLTIANLLFADAGNYAVAVANAFGSTNSQAALLTVVPAYAFTNFAGLPGVSGSTDGPGSAAQFNYAANVAVDSAGNVFVADYGNNTIRKVTATGVVTTLAGSAGIYGSADGTGSAAQFNGPFGVAVDSAGNVYVGDNGNNTIRKVTPTGVVTTLAGSAEVFGSTDGTGSAAQFNGPAGVAVDGVGDVYVADSGNNTIRKVTAAGVVTTLAGSSTEYPGSADGTGSAARFNGPMGVAVDSAGNVYVADNGNHTIRKVTAAGVVTTLAGSTENSGSVDGTGSAAAFNSPFDVAVDGAGNVFVVDFGDNTLRKVTSAGVVTTVGGTAGVAGAMDGVGVAAQFSAPAGVAVDSAGNLYVADFNNYRITRGTAVYGGGLTTPVLFWTNPTAITYGTALSSNQLNSTASVAGIFNYTPSAGTVLSVGTNLLSVAFTPNDLVDYTGATGSISQVVLPAPLSVTASNATRPYAQTNPVFAGTITGLTNGDNITANYTCSATTSRPPGSYLITPILSDPSNRLGNYTVTTNNGTLTVTCAAIALSPSTLPVGTTEAGYNQTLTASGGAGPYSFTITIASLPAGLSLSGGGLLSGTPLTIGTNTFTLTAADTNGCTGSQTFTLTVSAEVPKPGIASMSVSGANLVVNGNNGLSGRTYYVLMSENLALPLNQWVPIATNLLSGGGSFTLTATNAVSPAAPQRFYILQLQ